MNTVKQIGIKKCRYHFYDDMINIKNFDPNKIKIDENSYNNTLIYYIKYMTTNRVKLLYLFINKINEYIEERNRNKYLTLLPIDENK